jgi:hypothetical protein
MSNDKYNQIFHYTTYGGLIGILTSQCLWATHYKFLNDSSEIILFKEKLKELLGPLILEEYKVQFSKFKHKPNLSVENLEQMARNDTEVFVSVMYRVTGDDIYITSFCGNQNRRSDDKSAYINNNGILSQWRGYGSDGGFAIEFDVKELEAKIQQESKDYSYNSGHISDAIYSNNDKKFKQEVEETGLLSSIKEYVVEMIQSFVRGDTKEVVPNAEKAYPAFVQCISRYKHHGFEEENEVRIAVLPTPYNDFWREEMKNSGEELSHEKEKLIKFVFKNNRNVPYIELFKQSDKLLSIENIKQSDITLPIKRIIVGPNKDQATRAASLKAILRNTDIEVHPSDIPYIGN